MEYEEPTELNMPALLSANLPTVNVTTASTLADVQKEDLNVANAVLEVVLSGWKSVKTISGVCRLASTTFATIEARRKILNMPYGVLPSSSQKMTVYPID